ncbi:MAG TPA: rubredoxin [Lamprocystis sp. (in: g-proteobacteria)]|nr:rubredoxin [Lamprocystis sp. (in: g-proteobacteria)]
MSGTVRSPDDPWARLDPTTRMECKICRQVYDPGDGDPVWPVPAGTPFAELPAHWCCPQCDGGKDQFLEMVPGAV